MRLTTHRLTPSSDRRSGVRYTTLLRVGVLDIGGAKELCLIRNISAGGLMAHVYSSIAVGTRAAVELKTGQPVAGHVKWVEGANIGLEFDQPIDVDDVLTACTTGVKGLVPRMPRIEVSCIAGLRIGARTHRARTIDISQGGVKLQVESGVDPEPAVLSLPGFRPVHGQVRWFADGHAGIAFNQVIPLPDLIGWLKTREQVRRAFGPEPGRSGSHIAA